MVKILSNNYTNTHPTLNALFKCFKTSDFCSSLLPLWCTSEESFYMKTFVRISFKWKFVAALTDYSFEDIWTEPLKALSREH